MTPSPRRALILRHRQELLAIAERFGAGRLAVCGSVARDEDKNGSDIDFYVWAFTDWDGVDSRTRADALVREFRRVLAPFSVDVRGLPGWPLDPPFEASMKRDAIDLSDFGP